MSSSAITFESPPNSPPPSPPPPPPSAATAHPPATRGTPKFKSIPPPSLPISPPAFSPSSYFPTATGLTATDFLDSPVLLSSSHILASPTTGSFPLHAFNWNTNNQIQEHANFTDFSFENQSNYSNETYHQPKLEDFQMQRLSPEISIVQTSSNLQKPSFETSYRDDRSNYNHQSSHKKLDDGYNWRKYGQKQVKGSENPRSYYKCTYRNCSMRKKVESSANGDITEIIYRGNHDHPKPRSNKRPFSSSVSNNSFVMDRFTDYPDQSNGSGQLDLIGTPENSSSSIGDDEFSRGRSGRDELLENEANAKRSKMNNENEVLSMEGSRTIREPRVVVQTISDIDILDDGYRWRKYGQKVVKGNPNPRSYYKCTTVGCSVRKLVERASNDLRSVITTYEGKHTHDVPLARGASHRPLPPTNPSNSVAAMTIRPSELSHYYPSNSMINTFHGSRLPTSSETPFTLEMLHNPDGFELSGFDNPIRTSYMNRQPNLENVFSIPKDEPNDDSFLESLLY